VKGSTKNADIMKDTINKSEIVTNALIVALSFENLFLSISNIAKLMMRVIIAIFLNTRYSSIINIGISHAFLNCSDSCWDMESILEMETNEKNRKIKNIRNIFYTPMRN
jgi:hypothetical protein